MNGENGEPSRSVVEVLKLGVVRMASPKRSIHIYLGLVSLAVAVLSWS